MRRVLDNLPPPVLLWSTFPVLLNLECTRVKGFAVPCYGTPG